MKKRHIAIVIAGLVMGAAGVAAENLEVVPLSSRDAYAPEAAQFESTPADVAVVEVTPVAVVPVEVVPVEVVQVEAVQVVAVEPVIVANPKPAMISSIPQSADDMVWKPLPKQAKYLEERADRLLVATAIRGDTFPVSADDIVWKALPKQAKYLDDRAAQIQVATVRSDTIPPSADVSVLNPVSPLARY
jgi:hypothetical protein